MDKVQWGILGTASIARRHAIPAMKAVDECEVTAVASRSSARAQAFADELGIAKAYSSYEELLADKQIGAVYIPLPNDMHVEWIERAMQAGKHVLCEKPLGLNAAEVAHVRIIAEQTGCRVVEGVTSYFHPVHEQVAEWVAAGVIGKLKLIRISLGWFFGNNLDDFRWSEAHGGGALLDIGGYCVSLARKVAGNEPLAVSAMANIDAQKSVDTDMVINLAFPEGVMAAIDFSLLSAYRNEYTVVGTTGKMRVAQPFGNGGETRTIRRFDTRGTEVEEKPVTAHQMQAQFAQVSRYFRDGGPSPIPLAESLSTAHVLDACAKSAKGGGELVRM